MGMDANRVISAVNRVAIGVAITTLLGLVVYSIGPYAGLIFNEPVATPLQRLMGGFVFLMVVGCGLLLAGLSLFVFHLIGDCIITYLEEA